MQRFGALCRMLCGGGCKANKQSKGVVRVLCGYIYIKQMLGLVEVDFLRLNFNFS